MIAYSGRLIASLRGHVDEHFADDITLDSSMGIGSVREIEAVQRQARIFSHS